MRKLFCLLLLFAACASSPVVFTPGPPAPEGTLRFLFIGNSLTSTYQVPTQVREMAELAGLPSPIVVDVSVGGFSLEDHWNEGSALRELQKGIYDYVVLQQGPSTLVSSGENLTEFASKFATAANTAHARPAMYAIWPPKGGDLDAGIAHYEATAASAHTGLFPAAEAWRNAWAVDPAMPLYGSDDFHPSEHGAWLAALVIVATAYDRPVSEFRNIYADKITPAQEIVLRNAATKAIAEHGKR